MEDFKKFVGKWVHDSSNNVGEFFKLSGVTEDEVKMMETSAPVMTLSTDGKKCSMESVINPGQTPEVKGTIEFELGTTFLFEHPGNAFDVTMDIKDGKMIQNTIKKTGNMVDHKIDYEIINGDLKLTYTALSKEESKPISCERMFKKQ